MGRWYPTPGLEGVPHPRSRWGVPHPRSGWQGGYPILVPGRGVPHPADMGRWYPTPGLEGVPHPRSRWGVPHPRSGWQGGYPILVPGRGVPHPPTRTGWGNSAPIRQSSIASTCYVAGGYASCVHAGGLSCSLYFQKEKCRALFLPQFSHVHLLPLRYRCSKSYCGLEINCTDCETKIIQNFNKPNRASDVSVPVCRGTVVSAPVHS